MFHLDFICAAVTDTDGIAAFSEREMKQKFNEIMLEMKREEEKEEEEERR